MKLSRIAGIAKKIINDKIVSPPKPKVFNPDEHRIDRELAYSKRIGKQNPRLKALNERKQKAQRRRSI